MTNTGKTEIKVRKADLLKVSPGRWDDLEGELTGKSAAYEIATWLFDEFGYYPPAARDKSRYKMLLLRVKTILPNVAKLAVAMYKDANHDT